MRIETASGHTILADDVDKDGEAKTGWLKNRFCPKCQGDGWLWAHELDDTKYRCDHACHFD
jgi:ribosomal protein S27AE